MFLNTTETIGIVLGTATETTTGSVFITLLMVVVLLVTMCILFGIVLEWTALFILPLLLSYMAYYNEFIGIGAVILIYLSIVFTKNFIFR